MNKLLKMHGNGSGSGECISHVRVQTVAHIDQFPIALPFASRAASDLPGNEDDTVSAYEREQMWLDCPNEAAVVPMNQVPVLNCLSEIHSQIPVH
jgi:hypothetical protein